MEEGDDVKCVWFAVQCVVAAKVECEVGCGMWNVKFATSLFFSHIRLPDAAEQQMETYGSLATTDDDADRERRSVFHNSVQNISDF